MRSSGADSVLLAGWKDIDGAKVDLAEAAAVDVLVRFHERGYRVDCDVVHPVGRNLQRSKYSYTRRGKSTVGEVCLGVNRVQAQKRH